MVSKPVNREQWLNALAKSLRPMFQEEGYTIPENLRMSVGFPKGGRKAIGQCFASEASKDQTYEIFISPILADAPTVSSTVVHELVHATVGLACKHRGEFKKCATALGLEGKMTATTASADLALDLERKCKALGPYPHAELSPMTTIKKDGTRMLKVVCPTCSYTVRTTAKWIAEGLPTCPCGTEMEAVA